MKYGLRICVVLSGLVSFLLLSLLVRHLHDLSSQYRATAYVIDRVWSPSASQTDNALPDDGEADKVIVMAALEQERVDWVAQELPGWHSAIYIVNPSQRSLDDPNVLTTPMNKGHESIAYLSYIIEHYSSLPSVIAFLHAHRSGFLRAWHVDAPLHDNAIAMRSLQLDFVRQNGYVNLRCNWNPGCAEPHDSSTSTGRPKKHDLVTDEVWREIFNGTSVSSTTTTTTSSSSSNSTMDDVSADEHNVDSGEHSYGSSDGSPIIRQPQLRAPSELLVACCAQFVVSREQVLKRPLEDYIRFRQWVMTTERNDATTGRIMEYLWHIIFGKDAVYCPQEDLCYCQVYGRC